MLIAERRRTPLIALAVTVAVFAVYAALTPNAVGLGDEAEAQTVPYILGIAHPTGFPLYTLLGWVWSHALPIGVVAWRLNLFDAFCSALTAGGVFLLACSCARDRLAALFAALVFAFGGMSWTSALHANAQVVASTLCVFVLAAAIVYARTGEARLFVAACLGNGLALAAHPNAMWTLPAIAAALLWQLRVLTVKTLLGGALALALPLALYAYLPIRSEMVAAQHLDPNAAAPLYGAGRLDWDMNSPRTVSGFLDEVLGRKYFAGTSLARVPRRATVLNAVPFWSSLLVKQYDPWLLALAACGAVVLAWTDRRTLSVLACGTAGGIVFLYLYRLDAHIDRYALVSFGLVAALAAGTARMRVARIATICVLAITAAVSVFLHRPAAVPPALTGLGPIAAVEADIPDGAIVVAQWEEATALAYASFVSGTLGKRTVVGGWPSGYYRESLGWARVRPTYYFLDGFSWSRFPEFPPTIQQRRSDLRGYAVMQVIPDAPARPRTTPKR